MQLPFGKRAQCGNFYVLKHVRALSGKELRSYRSSAGIPQDVQKHLQRGVLPFITIGTVSDSWKIEFACGLDIYRAIDEIPVAVDGEGNVTYYGPAYVNLGNIINGWFAYTSTVGDAEYQATVIKAMQDYLERMGKKNGEPLSDKDNEALMSEIESTEKHKETLFNISNQIKKDDDKHN